MAIRIGSSDAIGLLRAELDAHSLGISSLADLLYTCGVRTEIAPEDIRRAAGRPDCAENLRALSSWVRGRGITVLGFSWRLDPESGASAFDSLVAALAQAGLDAKGGGLLRAYLFAGLPAACSLVSARHPGATTFSGGETDAEVLDALGLPRSLLPSQAKEALAYDDWLAGFGRDLVARGLDGRVGMPDRSGSPRFGRWGERLEDRLDHSLRHGTGPLLRAHMGPFLPDRVQAVSLFLSQTRDLACSGWLDVLSIGTSQLSQERFGLDWEGRSDGGGVPIADEGEFAAAWEAARPMLVRSYSATRDVAAMAVVLDRSLDMAWHALSFWWFSALDGRGPHPVARNLQEHFQALRCIAAAERPFEANVPHHFAFRGCDDAGCVAAGFLAARAAKEAGVRTFILQIMLNTPRRTWGVQDLAKARALLGMVRGLEEAGRFRVVLQSRAGLDYFSAREETARAQLAATTALADDIEPEDASSPPIIHVVSHSEARGLADPAIIGDSCRIVLASLAEHRRLRRAGDAPDMAKDESVEARRTALRDEAEALVRAIDEAIPGPSSPEKFHRALKAGFFPLPALASCREEFALAAGQRTLFLDGGQRVVDASGRPIGAKERAAAACEAARRLA